MNCKCGNALRKDQTWCDFCYKQLCNKWDKEIAYFLDELETMYKRGST